MSVIIQVFGSFIICCLCMSMSITLGWPSCTFQLFASSNTTLDRPMTETELALFGSLSCLGALVGTPTVGYLLDRMGRKHCTVLFSLMSVIAWTMIAASTKVEVILTAMFVSGLSGAAYLVVPVYVCEICQDSIRGAMTSGFVIFGGIGLLLTYVLGGVLGYYAMIYTCLGIAVTTTAACMLLKESPTCLMMKGLEKEAAKSLMFYRQLKEGSKELQHEMEVLKRSINPDIEETSPETEKLNEDSKPYQNISIWKFLKKSRSTRKAMYITLFLVTTSVFEGPIILQVYAVPLFQKATPSISSFMASIILAALGILSGVTAGYLSERAGRRPLLIYSTILTGISSLLLGFQLHLEWGPLWMVAVNIYFYITVFSLGAGVVPSILMAEVFLPQGRSFASMVVIEWAWFCSSVVLFIFNPLVSLIGLGPVFYIFAAVCLASSLFCIYFVPETKGLSVDEIQLRLLKRKGF